MTGRHAGPECPHWPGYARRMVLRAARSARCPDCAGPAAGVSQCVWPQCGGLSAFRRSSFAFSVCRGGSFCGFGSEPAIASVVTRRCGRSRRGAASCFPTSALVCRTAGRAHDRDGLGLGSGCRAEHPQNAIRDGIWFAEQLEGVNAQVVPSEAPEHLGA